MRPSHTASPVSGPICPDQFNLSKNTFNRSKMSSAVISCPLLRDGQSVTSSGVCSASQLVSEEWPCATRSMKHGLTSTRPLRPLLRWCNTSVALMKTAVTSWKALGLQCEELVVGRKRREAALQEKANDIYSQLDRNGQRAMSLAQEKGASIWLTTVPMDEHAFALSRGDFRDAICLRYGLETSSHAQPLLRRGAIHRGARAELQSRWLRVPSPQRSQRPPHGSPVRHL